MEKEFVPYEQALALKELGFDEPCFGYFDKTEIFHLCSFENMNDRGFVSAPLYQQAFRWFREKYGITSWVYNSQMDKFYHTILQNGRIVKSHDSSTTYEEAELECLKKLIEIVKENEI